jgi:hypothetical protein
MPRWDLCEAIVAGGVGGVVQPVQGVRRGFRPGLAGVGFGGGDQLAGRVRAAQRVGGCLVVGLVVGAVVDRQRVVHGEAGEAGQHPELVDRGTAPRRVQVVGGQGFGTGHMQPLLAAGHVQAGLVEMHQVRQA